MMMLVLGRMGWVAWASRPLVSMYSLRYRLPGVDTCVKGPAQKDAKKGLFLHLSNI